MPVATLEGYRYWITFICGALRFWVVALLKHKSDALAEFKRYKAYAENFHGLKILEEQDDGGGEYMGHQFDKLCIDEGISRRHTEPDEPYQNGIAERANRDIAEGAITMLYEAHLSPSFWGHAVLAFVYVRNRCPTAPLPGTTPYTGWYKKKPDVSNLRVFGCLAYVHIKKNKRRGLQPRTMKCIFVGYPSGTKAWKCWNPVIKKLIISSHVVFDERVFPGNTKTLTNPFDDLFPSLSDLSDPLMLPDQGGDSNLDDNDLPPPENPPVLNPSPPPSPSPSASPLPPDITPPGSPFNGPLPELTPSPPPSTGLGKHEYKVCNDGLYDPGPDYGRGMR